MPRQSPSNATALIHFCKRIHKRIHLCSKHKHKHKQTNKQRQKQSLKAPAAKGRMGLKTAISWKRDMRSFRILDMLLSQARREFWVARQENRMVGSGDISNTVNSLVVCAHTTQTGVQKSWILNFWFAIFWLFSEKFGNFLASISFSWCKLLKKCNKNVWKSIARDLGAHYMGERIVCECATYEKFYGRKRFSKRKARKMGPDHTIWREYQEWTRRIQL